MTKLDYPRAPRTLLEGLRYCRNPLLVIHHFRHVKRRQAFISTLTGASEADVQQIIDELDSDTQFQADILEKRRQFLGAKPRGTDFMYLAKTWGSQFFSFYIHYSIVRLLKPTILVETGGTPGSSSAFMLRAMERNNSGTLVTLDLPNLSDMKEIKTEGEKLWYSVIPKDLPPGWGVPSDLKARHVQVLGDARETLPDVLKQYPQFDIFIHDSDHSYEHMTWEYQMAWPHIKSGGLLCSDDVSIHTAFDDFGREVGLPTICYNSFGAIRKP